MNVIENSSSNGTNKYSNNNEWTGQGFSNESTAVLRAMDHSFNHKSGCERRAASNEPRNLMGQRESSSFINNNRQHSRDRNDKKKSKCSCFLPLTTSPPTPTKAERSKPYQSMFVSNIKYQMGNGTSREAENLLRKSDNDDNSLSRSHVDSTRNCSVMSNSNARGPNQTDAASIRNHNTQINFKKDGRHTVSLASTRRVNGIPDHSYSLRLNGSHHQQTNNNDPNSFYRNS